LSVAFSPCPPCGLDRLWRWLPALPVLAPLLWTTGANPGAGRALLRWWGVAGALVALVLTGEHAFGSLEWIDGRLGLPYVHPNALAAWLVLSAAAALASWRHRGGWLAGACFGVCAAAVIMTQSKAGGGGIWLLMLVATIAIKRRSLRWASRTVLVVSAAAALLVLIRAYPRSIQDRGTLAWTAIRAVLERPVLGWGLGNLHVHLHYAWEHIWNAGVLDWHTHNLYLQTAESSGFIGLGALLVVLVIAVTHAQGWDRLPLVLAALLGLADYVLEWPGIMPALVLALGVAGPVHVRARGSPTLGAIGAALIILGGTWGSLGQHECSSDPVRALERARELWEGGRVRESLDAYLEAARADPAEEWAVGVWEEGGLRCLKSGARRDGVLMLGRAVLVRPETVLKDYWQRFGAGGTRSRPGLSEVFACAERDARLLFRENRVGGAMLLGNLARAYYLAGRRGDAEHVFLEIRHLLPLPRGSDESQPDLDAWMEAWLEKQKKLTGRHRFQIGNAHHGAH
jgi:hypothetical protein